MSPFNNQGNLYLYEQMSNKKIIKIITGLNNFNIHRIIKVVKTAELGGATYIDIAANPKIVFFIKSITFLPICVSSIDPSELYNCFLAGANIFEIGNFDAFYDKKILFSKDHIIYLAKKTRELIKESLLCVTIPCSLPIHEQIELAIDLEKIGINLLQTEGLTSKSQSLDSYNPYLLSSIQKASLTLSSTYAISQFVNIPIITSSGISNLSAPLAIYYGASGVGLASALTKYDSISSMANYIKETAYSVSSQYDYSLDKPLVYMKTQCIDLVQSKYL
uniref:Uncharacterized protein ycf23 n=1 Tax=Schizymenia dubyi TaxID=38368 RepID=A0A1C9C9A5_9FLOR|nr:hypothetical protein Schiz_083 [Schizymenia dubyi]AOM64966.1 hypothetical protein Schiz_083 [Schizymenia dubyi]